MYTLNILGFFNLISIQPKNKKKNHILGTDKNIRGIKHKNQAGHLLGFPCGSAGKESACNVRDLGQRPGLNPWIGKIPWIREGYPLHYSGLKKSMDCRVHGVAESDVTEQLSLHFTSHHLFALTMHKYVNHIHKNTTEINIRR